MNASAASTYWVVVADESQAILYSRAKKYSPLVEFLRLENETAKEKVGDLLSDKGGRSFDSHGQGRHTFANEKSGPKEQAATVFAKQLAERLAAEHHRGRFGAFAIVAAPRFLGLLRSALSSSLKLEPYATIDKEVVGKDPAFIAGLLDEA